MEDMLHLNIRESTFSGDTLCPICRGSPAKLGQVIKFWERLLQEGGILPKYTEI